jgi:hypothetical protein
LPRRHSAPCNRAPSREIDQALTINIVFIGYEEGTGPLNIDTARLQSLLPKSYRTVNRYPQLYGIPSPAGTSFRYTYNIVYADQT